MFENYNSSVSSMIFHDDAVKRAIIATVDTGMTSNVMLHGSNGVGKSLIADLIFKEVVGDNISTSYCITHGDFSTSSLLSELNLQLMNGAQKAVIVINEIDRLTTGKQYDLQQFIDAYCSKNSKCRIVVTSNYENKVINAISSRCKTLEIIGPVPTQVLRMFTEELASHGVTYTSSIAAKLLSSALNDNCSHLDMRNVEELVIETVYSVTGNYVG